ncbi:MAG: hypothetical protein AAFZ15_05900 [Bacteroidota bacterium]
MHLATIYCNYPFFKCCLFLGIVILIACSTKDSSSLGQKKVSEKKLPIENIEGEWISASTTTFSPSGRVQTKTNTSGIDYLQFKTDSFLRKINYTYDVGKNYFDHGAFYTKHDTLSFDGEIKGPSKFQFIIKGDSLIITEFNNGIFLYSKKVFKKLNRYRPKINCRKLEDHLIENSFEIVDQKSFKYDCHTESRFEFFPQNKFIWLRDCISKGWNIGDWFLDSTAIDGELFLKFPASVPPIQLIGFKDNQIIGKRYTVPDSGFKINKINNIYDQNNLIGKWKSNKKKSSKKTDDIESFIITENSFSIVRKNGITSNYSASFSNSNEIIYLNKVEPSREEKNFWSPPSICIINKADKNSVDIYFKNFRDYLGQYLHLEK